MSDADPASAGPAPSPVGTLVTDQWRRMEVAMLSRVLTTTLAQALPPAMVSVERRRSVGDRLAGRPGAAIGVVIHAGDQDLGFRSPDIGVTESTIAHVVRGVTLSRRTVPPAVWLDALAAALNTIAVEDEQTRQALRRTMLT